MKCKKCRKIGEFYIRQSGPRVGEPYEKCKKCMKTRGVAYYQANKVRQAALSVIRKNKRKWFCMALVILAKEGRPCADCGMKFPPSVMDFDHTDPSLKVDSISTMACHGNLSPETIVLELEKCDLVCANCHRIRTHGVVTRVEVLDVIKNQRPKLKELLRAGSSKGRAAV